jgi:hypothetical protein
VDIVLQQVLNMQTSLMQASAAGRRVLILSLGFENIALNLVQGLYYLPEIPKQA